MTRVRRAWGIAVLLVLLAPTIAEAAWSTQQQVVEKLSSASPVIGVDAIVATVRDGVRVMPAVPGRTDVGST